MNPVTHLLAGWAVACSAHFERRDRAIVALAGVAPDVDGLGFPVEWLTRDSAHPILWFSDWHHVLAHNVGGALVVTAAAFALGKRRALVAALACASFHLHLLCDLLGARGPDGEPWPIPYSLPFSHAWRWTWSGQWSLNAWPNFVLTGALLLLAFYVAWRRGHSPVEIFSRRADAAFVKALRDRFGVRDDR